jgi:hypothetical protein
MLPALPVWLGMGVVCLGLAIGLAPRRRTVTAQKREAAAAKLFHPSSAAIVTDE